jgi:hypothetical protein
LDERPVNPARRLDIPGPTARSGTGAKFPALDAIAQIDESERDEPNEPVYLSALDDGDRRR